MPSILNRIFDFIGRRSIPEPNQFDKGNTLDSMPVVSYAESPNLYIFDQFKVAIDRISVIREVGELLKKDLRFQVTNSRLTADATRGGFKVIVQGSEADRERQRRQGKQMKRLTPGANIAQQVVNDLLKRTKLSAKSTEYARALTRDGDLFLNPIVDLQAGLILDVRRAPPLTIKRNTDEFGEFPDIERAFSQIDPQTQIQSLMEIGPPESCRTNFALYQMNHIRWLCDETLAYGTSHYASARMTYKVLQKMEFAAAIRREFRSVQKYGHKLPEGSQPSHVTQYMRDVGLIDKDGNPTRNAHLLSDFVGTADVKVLNGDANLDEMGDIKYFEELLWLNLGVPKAILTAGRDINRDVLKVQYPHYLETLEDITDILEYGDTGPFSGIRAIIDLQLLLAGINPDSVLYDIVWSQKSTETQAERIERVQAALGKGGGKKLITTEKAVQTIADDFDIEDPIKVAEQLEEEERQRKLDNAHIAPTKHPEIDNTSGRKDNAPKEEELSLTDAAEDGLPSLAPLDGKAEKVTLRFFKSVYNDLMQQKPVTDSSDDDDDDEEDDDLFSVDDIISLFDESWDVNKTTYRIGLNKWLTKAGEVGADRAAELVEKKTSGDDSETGIGIRIHIPRKDIQDDLYNAAAARIENLREPTKRWIRETLAAGFEQNKGWKEIAEELQAVIVNETRATTIAITELSWAYGRMQLRVYENAGYTRVMANEVHDMRTCDKCKARHGTIYSIQNCPGLAHPRCRVDWLPVD
ncbi:minor capsid protein [Aneurinibacillus aneurinilyticus]|jgi:SPP1 gp7 family putative phage head morphogenesis protein|uniref:minor capsid protein n=1 Tax=Aneurinibacillus aneurinilyticus TaxID=1391 RepID=UPI0023F97874|nr:minor capsid protein [Aneurinibacillus aneurinilyticus]MCI1696476.1 minor capsid protein [Aneurinibacillus aneurinilyticus]